MMRLRTFFTSCLLAILAAAPAPAQVLLGVVVPPQSVVGNPTTQPAAGQAIPFAQLAAGLSVAGNLLGPGTPAGGALAGTYPNPSLATVNANVGSFGSSTQCVTFSANSAGQITAASAATCTPAFSSITGTPTTLAGYGVTSPLPIAQGGTADTGTAWAAYTPTLACSGGGSLTTSSSSGRWKAIGKTYFVEISATLTAVGTCVGPLTATLPNSITCAAIYVIVGREQATTGKQVNGYCLAAASTVAIAFYDNSSVIVNGYNPTLSGVVEAQ